MSDTMFADPTMQMRKVVLHGRLKRVVGQEEFQMMATSPKDAISCLCTQVPGFQKTLMEGWYRCILARAHLDGDAGDLGDLDQAR